MENGSKFILDLILILGVTNIGGLLSAKLKQPSVLGQILAGLIIGPALLNLVEPSNFISNFAEIGVILLMFMAGMETNIMEMKKSAGSSTVIALAGMIVPFALGFLTIKLVFKNEGMYQAVYSGVILTATSISITVQTLRELGKLKDRTGVNIMGAAIADDIGGIILLTLVVGMSDPVNGSSPLMVILKVIVFFVIILLSAKVIKQFMSKYSSKLAYYITPSSIALISCLIFAYLAEMFDMAAIIGAYSAGLIFSIIPNSRKIELELNTICYVVFTPVFFANIGLGVSFENISSVIFPTIVITIVAIISKVLGAGLGAKLAKFTTRESLQIGIGMIPRGEVAIITANLGRNAGMINDRIFTAIVIMSIVTSVVTPILLKKSYGVKVNTSKSENINQKAKTNVNVNKNANVNANM
ncbi:Kef-type K+ transport system membrane component KefB [Sedimentibacter acidaminivorans]|uniref:Kef-type K+ transport system membrane component KefB n=1 Tax=Sedimentibacter acidaminivorans TaxID=913099 RepID=A0ABS4GGT4_9FIRM|nr:cation:proton antiporter [Sedimentibacter acidaminivorans]MBP1926905.1 Kef-type K+ transport system membrane component KefB [Sedimentibacter acidaminivorans]